MPIKSSEKVDFEDKSQIIDRDKICVRCKSAQYKLSVAHIIEKDIKYRNWREIPDLVSMSEDEIDKIVSKTENGIALCFKCHQIVDDPKFDYTILKLQNLANEHLRIIAGVKSEHLCFIENQNKLLVEGSDDIMNIILMKPVSTYLSDKKVEYLKKFFSSTQPSEFEMYLFELVNIINHNNKNEYEKLIIDLLPQYTELISKNKIYYPSEKQDKIFGWISLPEAHFHYKRIKSIYEKIGLYYPIRFFYIMTKKVLTKTRNSKEILKLYGLCLE